MKISLEKKILFGFIINLFVVIASGWIFASRLYKLRNQEMDSTLHWIELLLFILSVILLVIVYLVRQSQLSSKNSSQDMLTQNRELLQSILDNTSNPVFVKKVNGEYLLVNKQCESLFHLPKDKIIGKTDHEFLPENVADAFRNSDLEVVKTRKEIRTEQLVPQPDGPHTFISVKFPLYDSERRIYAIGGISTDITERIKIEGSLKASDEFFNMAFDILTLVKNERFVKINPAFTKLLGYNQKDLDNIIFTDLTHPDDKRITEEVLARLMKGETVVNFKNRLLSKDGTYKWLDWQGNFDHSLGILYSVARDITENVLLETEQQVVTKLLYENEERLRLVIENISEGVIVANAAKEVVMANDMANEILGIEDNVKIPYNLTDRFEVYLPDEKTIFPSQNLPMERALAGEETNDLDLILRNSNQKKRILISGRPLVDHDNKIVAGVVTIKDISKYKQLEKELKETETKYRQLIGYKAGEKN